MKAKEILKDLVAINTIADKDNRLITLAASWKLKNLP